MRLMSVAVIASLLPSSFAWGLTQPPLSRIPVPVPRSNGELAQAQYGGPNGLAAFVKDVPAAIALGKALFWDMQAGSDGTQACASCHYGAGADPVSGSFRVTRARNQLHPGPDAVFGNNSTVIKTFATVIDPVTLVETDIPLPPLRADGNPRLRPNYELNVIPFDLLADFPLFKVIPAEARLAINPLAIGPLAGTTEDAVSSLADTNDVVGSQGIRLADFLAINNNSAVDAGTALADPIFHTVTPPNADPANNVRQVTGRNAPSVINAVFNYTNFWDGRANNIFNGENRRGPQDPNAGIWLDNGAALVKRPIAIPNSSLASQAVSSALDDKMMSFKGRTFPELGRKMLSLTRPLDQQFVHPSDSFLGTLSRANPPLPDGTLTGNRGLATNYQQMIRDAFLDIYWNSINSVTLPTRANPAGEPFSQMEANFSLFWGLAIQLYEATLVSDQAPFDRFQSGNQNALSAAAQRGFVDFDGRCTVCHSGAEFTSAAIGSSITPCTPPDCNRPVFTNNTTHSLIRQEANPDTFALSVNDTGFSNLGIRPTPEDLARGAGEPDLLFPLSFTRLARLTPPPPFVTPLLPPLVAATTPDVLDGSFKIPGLRNVELTPPYFHNGTALTLEQVMELYTRGGNFPGNPQLAAAMAPISTFRSNPNKRVDVVEFLKSLTDARVRNEQAPFDHPELFIPNGVDGQGADILLTLSATGGAPAPVAPAVLTLNPVTSPTILTSQLLSGTVDTDATVTVSINGGTPVNATVTPCVRDPLTLECTTAIGTTSTWSATVTGMPIGLNTIGVTATSVTGGIREVTASISVMPAATIGGVPLGGKTNQNSATLTVGGVAVVSYQVSLDGGPFSADIPIAEPIILTGLSDGIHTVKVLGKDANGNQPPPALATTAIWTIKVAPPVLTLNPITTPTGNSSQTISGTVELGAVPLVSVNPPALAGLVRTIGGSGISTWSCDITGLVSGANNITITALDIIPNITTVTGIITRVLRDGNFKGSGAVDISDALKALRFAVNLEQPTASDMIHGDIAPLVNGVTTQNNTIDIADALLILRKTVGLVTF
jgi:cytochrome c peroxidase